jgi:plastocyanin
MKKVFLGIGLWAIGLILITACGSAPVSATPAEAGASTPTMEPLAPAHVEMRGMTFIPLVLKVKPGTTVIWTNMDLSQHNVIADDGGFKSGMVAGGQNFQFTFPKAGLYRYYCSLHGGPGGKGMSGTVEVAP